MEPYLPEHMREGMKNWIEHGIEPGGFLRAVLCNDLKEAVGRADHINMQYLPNIVSYCYNNIPTECWGSVKRYNDWYEQFQQKQRG